MIYLEEIIIQKLSGPNSITVLSLHVVGGKCYSEKGDPYLGQKSAHSALYTVDGISKNFRTRKHK